MREQDRGTLAALFVINVDSVAIEIRHESSGVASRDCSSSAIGFLERDFS
jgi:hypothetical protein